MYALIYYELRTFKYVRNKELRKVSARLSESAIIYHFRRRR